MEENRSISWRARLAKSNINILDVHDDYIFLEFTYHPRPGTFKWCKTYFELDAPLSQAGDDEYEDYEEMNASDILDKVLALRKELEG